MLCSVFPSNHLSSPQPLHPSLCLLADPGNQLFFLQVVYFPLSPFPPWDGLCIEWVFKVATTYQWFFFNGRRTQYGPVTLHNQLFICTNWYVMRTVKKQKDYCSALQMTPRQREEVEIKVCVTGVEQSSLQNCVQVNDTHLSTTTVKKHTCRNNKARFQDRRVEGKGQRYWKGHVSHSWTWVTRVQLQYLRELNRFFGCGISKISCITSLFGFHVITAGIPCSRLVSVAETNRYGGDKSEKARTLVLMNWNRMSFGDRPQDFNLFSLLKGGCGLSRVLVGSTSLIIHETKAGEIPQLEAVISSHIQSTNKGFKPWGGTITWTVFLDCSRIPCLWRYLNESYNLNQTQATSEKSTQRDFRPWFCQSFGDHMSKNLGLHLRCLQRLLRLSPSLDLNTHSHIKKVDLHMSLGVHWAVCVDTLGGLWRIKASSQRSVGKGITNRHGGWEATLTTEGANGYYKWELQVGCQMLQGWRWRRKLCLTTPWQISPSKTQLLGLIMGPGNFSWAVYFPLACRQF